MDGDIKIRLAKFIEVSEAKQEEIRAESDRVATLGVRAQETSQVGDYLSYILSVCNLHDKKFQFVLDHVGFMTQLSNLLLVHVTALQSRLNDLDGDCDA